MNLHQSFDGGKAVAPIGTAVPGGSANEQVDPRIKQVVKAILSSVQETVRDLAVTYSEFEAAKRWFVEVGENDEWPLLLDISLEHVVEEVSARTRRGTATAAQGPYYLPNQRRFPAVAKLPMQHDVGTPLVLSGSVRDLNGSPLPGAEIDIWHADSKGRYSGFAYGVPIGDLRGVVVADDAGRFEIHTTRPAPYSVPTRGPTGKLVVAAGWNPWHAAHIHVIVRAAGYRSITTQLWFRGSDWLDSDVANAPKDDLITDLRAHDDGTLRAEFDFIIEPSEANPDPA